VATADDNPRITVSRDALRADLAEMELRLRVYFDEQLKHKADSAQVDANTRQLQDLRRGDFSPAFRRTVEEIAIDAITERTDAGWTSRQRTIAVVAIFVAIFSLLTTIYAVTTSRTAPKLHGSSAALVKEVS